MDAHHDHPANVSCQPSCPAWSEGALQLFALRRSYTEMLEACRAAEAIRYVIVNPAEAGVVLPEQLMGEDFVQLNLSVPRDTTEVLLDEWGLRATLTFRGRRFDCAFPWPSVRGGVLKPPARKRPRFGVIEGGKKD